ncbi:MAG: peptide chain release factor N(5)-glutamine methyltransferase [Firmicutes bacterium]|jgi:release factor glutamine methyltransferase|nr:peptide chain release factor N(5)-glutamine methyltransferase [Bacillota bacterium]
MSLPLKDLIKIGENQLREAGVKDAAIDAKELFCYLMHMDRTKLMLRWQDVMQDNQCEAYFDLVAKRAARIPVQHIIGTQEFMGLTFFVSDKVLIPRQDTETLVEDALDIISKNKVRNDELPIKPKGSWSILDLGCGSGAIGISLAKLADNVKVTCSDVSQEALTVAEKNAKSLGAKSVKFVNSDMFASFTGKMGNKKFDMIISNPPYICKEVIATLEPEVKKHEPMMALDGGEDGLKFYRIIVDQAPLFLKKSGVVMVEIGHDQMSDVTKLFAASGRFSFVTGLKDLAGRDRIVAAVLSQKK